MDPKKFEELYEQADGLLQ